MNSLSQSFGKEHIRRAIHGEDIEDYKIKFLFKLTQEEKDYICKSYNEEFFDLTTLNGITLVEWAENCPGILPERRYQVTITKKGETERLIEIEPKGLV